MESISSSKKIAVVSLIVGIIALSIGFAAYTTSLTISSFTATVGSTDATPFSSNVIFSDGSMSCVAGTEISGGTTSATVSSSGTFSNDGKSWSDIGAVLAHPGDTVTCTARIENNSTFVAYLTSISTTGALACSAETGDTAGIFTDACADLSVEIEISTASATATSSAAALNNTMTAVSIAQNTNETVTVTITYPEDADLSDGTFTLTVPTINLGFSTKDNEATN